MLDVGQAVVRLAERYNDPFLIKVPYIPLKKENVDNDYVIQRMNTYIRTYLLKKAINNSTEEKKINEEMEVLRKVYFKSGVNTNASELRKIHIEKNPKTFHEVVVDNLTGEEKTFLELVKSEELNVSQAYARLSLSARKGNAIKDSLIKKQLIQVKEEKNDKGWKKLLMPAIAASVTA